MQQTTPASTSAQQDSPTISNTDNMNANTNSRGSMPIIIVLVILTLAGIGGTVWGIISNLGKTEEISGLQADIADQKATISRIEDALGVKIDEEESSNGGEDSSKDSIISQPVKSSKDYIYIGEWGIKIKIPDDLEYVSYKYLASDGYDEGSLCVTGAKKGVGSGVPGFAKEDFSSNYANGKLPSLGCLGRYASEDKLPIASGPSVTYEIGGYIYGYSHPQAISTSNQDEVQWEVDTTDIIEVMLTKNVSEF